MKKALSFLFFMVAIVSLSACGPSPEEQAERDQYNEWEAQVEEVRPRLEGVLSGLYGAEVSVYQLSGEINASVNVPSNEADREGFGVVVGLLGNHFVELAEEYSEYSFGDITFIYRLTSRYGQPEDISLMTYSVGADGKGRFTEPNADIPALFNATPDEIYYHLSGKSADDTDFDSNEARSISDPTWIQESLVPENSFMPLSGEIFSTTADENSLGGTPFYAYGTVEELLIIEEYDLIRFSTDLGDLYVGTSFIPVPDFKVGDQCTMFFVYEGMSSKADGPICSYIHHE